MASVEAAESLAQNRPCGLLNDAMKADMAYQRDCRQQTIPFPPGSVWVCYSDQATHAVMSGQFMMEQTYFLPPEAMVFPAQSPQQVLEHRGALLNTGDNTLTYQGQRVSLTKNEYRILLCLMQSKGRVVSREKLMERLWETDSFVDENTLTVNIGRLRKKLDAAGLPGFITTRVGLGYMVG